MSEAPPPDAEDLWLLVVMTKKPSLATLIVFISFLEVATRLGYNAAVGINMQGNLEGNAWVRHIPTYENPGTVKVMLGWCGSMQMLVVVMGAAAAYMYVIGSDIMRQQMAALEWMVSAPVPRLSFRHAANVAAWCRLRDEVMWKSQDA